jgi:hypothetical protein
VLANLLSSAGPATSVIESLASSIGAGLVVGGFVGGLRGFLLTRSRSQSEEQALKGSYLGGAGGWCCSPLIPWGNILSEQMNRRFKNANIGIAAMVILLMLGLVVLPDSERATGAFGIGAFAVGMGVYFFLDWRDERAQGKRARRFH